MLTEKYRRALDYAFEAHLPHTRKDRVTPYFSHVAAVSSLVLEYGGNEDQAIAGLLHDVIEDCGIEHAEPIRRQFGDDVLRIVMDCTDSTELPKRPWRERKERYIASLAGKPDDSLLVSCCDKLHNARAMVKSHDERGEELWDWFNSDLESIGWYYRSLTEQFLARNVAPAPELHRVVESVFAAR